MPSYKGPLSNKHIDQNVSSRPDAMMSLLGFIVITAFMIIKDKERFGKFFVLLKNKQFMITLLGIIIFSAWQLNSKEDDAETDRRKRATREAILGLIIAVLAYLDLKLAPFFIIWIVSYYLDK
jgi:SNF family Na+-dependent transporter